MVFSPAPVVVVCVMNAGGARSVFQSVSMTESASLFRLLPSSQCCSDVTKVPVAWSKVWMVFSPAPVVVVCVMNAGGARSVFQSVSMTESVRNRSWSAMA